MSGWVPWGTELAATVDRFGSLEAVHDGATAICFADLAGHAASLAAMLRDRGVQPGQPVVSSLPNGIPAVWGAMALRLVGAAEVALNARLTESERRHCLTLSQARLAITSTDQADTFRALGCDTIAIEDVEPESPDPRAFPPVPADAWGRIGFTSGTTGQPKAVVTTHGARWIGNILQRAHFDSMPGPGSRVLLMTPFVHGAGLLAHAFHDLGAGIVLLDGVDLPVATTFIIDGTVDFVFAPPTVLAKLLTGLEGRRIETVRTVFCGTAPLPRALYERAKAVFGPVVRITYGKTEIVNPIAVLQPPEVDRYFSEAPQDGACVGWPGAGVEIELRGEERQVFLRGRHMSCGHIDADGFHPLPPDGFHDSGDLGRIDDQGRLHLIGRMADVIKSGGYKIHPDEIEQALARTGAMVSVVSLPSDYWGEVIVGVGETDDPSWPERAQAALSDLSRHKHPRVLLTMSELPRNHQGKVMRRLIREALMSRYHLVDGPHPTLEPR